MIRYGNGGRAEPEVVFGKTEACERKAEACEKGSQMCLTTHGGPVASKVYRFACFVCSVLFHFR